MSRVLFGRGRDESERWVAFRSHFAFGWWSECSTADNQRSTRPGRASLMSQRGRLTALSARRKLIGQTACIGQTGGLWRHRQISGA